MRYRFLKNFLKDTKWLSDEPPFDPERHLSLESPSQTLSLEDLGYPSEEIQDKATTFDVSEPFRILSKEGSEVMLETARRLRTFSRRAGNRIENTVRGGCYRSRWLRDLCISQDVNDLIASIYQTETSPHTCSLGAPELSALQTGRGCG